MVYGFCKGKLIINNKTNMKAKIDLKIQGIRGGNPSWNPNKGRCVMHIDHSNVTIPNYISADAFTGEGKTYQRREECEIEINKNGKSLFRGTFNELCKILETAYGDNRVHNAGSYLCESGDETIEDQICLIENYLAAGGSGFDLCSSVDGVTVWQPLEDTLTIRDFLQSI